MTKRKDFTGEFKREAVRATRAWRTKAWRQVRVHEKLHVSRKEAI